MKKVRGDYPESFIDEITASFLNNVCEPSKVERIRKKIEEVRHHNYDALFLEMYFSVKEVLLSDAMAAMKKFDEVGRLDEMQIALLEAGSVLQEKIITYLDEKQRKTAQKGGQAKAEKIEQCRLEFLRMVDQDTSFRDKTKGILADAVLKLKPGIVEYAKKHHNSAITANTGLPKKWLEKHWGIEKRSYKNRVLAKQN